MLLTSCIQGVTAALLPIFHTYTLLLKGSLWNSQRYNYSVLLSAYQGLRGLGSNRCHTLRSRRTGELCKENNR
jgi:hypothetical protein